MTVAEYEQIPNPSSGVYELHHGVLVLVSYPTFNHGYVGRQIVSLLEGACGSAYYVDKEFACRPLPEYEVWSVDVGMAGWDRAEAIDEGWLMGSPDLVVEILSPSNPAREMADRERTMFAGGCRQFWVVDATKKTVRVSTPEGQSKIYGSGDMIPLEMFGGPPIPVDAIFALRRRQS